VLGGALHVGQRHLAQLVAIQEKQAPVADRGVLRERAHQLAAFELRALDVVQQVHAGALDFLGGDLLLRHAFHHASNVVRALARSPSFGSCAPKYM